MTNRTEAHEPTLTERPSEASLLVMSAPMAHRHSTEKPFDRGALVKALADLLEADLLQYHRTP